MRLYIFTCTMLIVSRLACAVDLQMTPPDVHVYETETFSVTCVVTGEYHAQYHSIHFEYLARNGNDIFVTNDETVSRTLDASRQQRYSVVKKTFGSAVNPRWEFTLTITNADKADTGRYQCVRVERSTKNSQHSSVLTRVSVDQIIPASPIAPQCALSPANPLPGQSTTFSCFSIGEAPKLSLTWTKGDAVLPTKVSNSTGKFNVATFQRTVSGWDNNSTFTCTAKGLALGTETRSCSVVPFFIPTNVTVTNIQRVKTGEPAEFICLAQAAPPANKYVWTVSKGAKTEIIESSNGRYVLEQGGALLRINSVTASDNNSSVQCLATNDMNIEGTNNGTLFTVAITSPSGPGTVGTGGFGTRSGNGKNDGNYGIGADGKNLSPHPGVIVPGGGSQGGGANRIAGDGPNIPLLVGGTVGLLVFMSMIAFVLAILFRSRSRFRPQKKNKFEKMDGRPMSIVSMNAAIDLEKADVALVKGNTLARGHTISRSLAARKSVANLPLADIGKSSSNSANLDASRQQLADKLAATLRTKSYVSLVNSPQSQQPENDDADDDCVSRVSTEGTCIDSAYDELTCSMSSTILSGRSNSVTSPQSCYGSVASLAGSVQYSKGTDKVNGINSTNLMYAELDWSGRTPPSGKILEGDEKTLYAQIRK